MLTLILARDDVAAGDTYELGRVVELPDDARLGDLVLAVTDGFLATVAGDVSWVITLRHGARWHLTDGEPTIEADSGTSEPYVVVFAPANGRPTVSDLTNRRPQNRISDVVVPADGGEYLVHARYLSHGWPTELDEYRTWWNGIPRPAN